jgi:hypothetical protein
MPEEFPEQISEDINRPFIYPNLWHHHTLSEEFPEQISEDINRPFIYPL